MNSRESILNKLRQAQQPFVDVPPIETRRAMSLVADESPEALKQRFIAEAEKLNCQVWPVGDDEAAIEKILELVGDDKTLMHWDFDQIPLEALHPALEGAGISRSADRDAGVRCGLTGVDAALAATGSIVLSNGKGKSRRVSLLPPVHIAVVRSEQIVPHFEAWIQKHKDAGIKNFQATSNHVVISGASRTADIAMELVLGAHGPAELHCIVVK